MRFSWPVVANERQLCFEYQRLLKIISICLNKTFPIKLLNIKVKYDVKNDTKFVKMIWTLVIPLWIYQELHRFRRIGARLLKFHLSTSGFISDEKTTFRTQWQGWSWYYKHPWLKIRLPYVNTSMRDHQKIIPVITNFKFF